MDYQAEGWELLKSLIPEEERALGAINMLTMCCEGTVRPPGCGKHASSTKLSLPGEAAQPPTIPE